MLLPWVSIRMSLLIPTTPHVEHDKRVSGERLDLLDWYRALLANRLGPLGEAHLQDTIIEARFNFVLIDSVGKPHRSLEAAIAAFHHAIILLLFIAL